MAQDTYVTPTIRASGTTWAQYKTGGLKLVLDKLVTASAAIANPTTTATATATGGGASGGLLAAGDYFIKYSWVDAFGETLAGGVSAELTVEATNIPRITIPALPTGVQSANIYLTPADGAAGTELLYATGVTTTTFDAEFAAPVDQPTKGLPLANTTGAAGHVQKIYALLGAGASEGVLKSLSHELSNYLSGKPMQRKEIMSSHVAWTGVVKLWYTALSEISTLVFANLPEATTSTANAAGIPQHKWTLPA